MKQLSIFFIGVLGLSLTSQVLAQTKVPTKTLTVTSPTVTVTPTGGIKRLSGTVAPSPSSLTPTPSPTGGTIDKDIQTLKDKVANKVAELTKNNQKAVAGYLTSVKAEEFKIKSIDDKSYTIKIDSVLTKFFQIVGNQKKEVKLDAFTNGKYVIISGPAIGESITANVVYIDERLEVKSGKVTEVDSNNDLIKVSTTEKDNYTVNILRTTKLLFMDTKTLEIDRTVLSKIKEGDTVHFTYVRDPAAKDGFKVDAQKVLVTPQEYFLK